MTAAERLTLRVLSALLREDVVGLRTRSTLVDRPDGRWLRLPSGAASLLLPVAHDGFQCENAARLPLLRREPAVPASGPGSGTGPSPGAGSGSAPGTDLTSCDDILRALGDLAEPQDRAGFDAYAAECRQTLATMRLHDAVQATVHERLARRYGEDPSTWTGMGGSLALDTLAAYLDHPVYPTARGRAGLTDDQLRSHAPEFHPSFTLRWATVRVPGRAPTVLPVHPLTAAALPPGAVLSDRPGPEVIPTLSMRTVALAHDPTQHLKLPLPTATLGLRNRRTIKPGTLTDGAAGQRLLQAVVTREPRFAASILHADEQRFDHAGHELLAVLYRRYPPGLDGAVIVPLAALLAPGPGGRLVIDRLADRFYDGDPLALLDAYLTLLIDWQTTLFSYGIALESHQQNTSLVLDRPRPGSRARLRLLLKDNDGPRVNTTRARGLPADFVDPRTFTDHDQPLIDVFTTITVHLCAGAFAFGLPAHRDHLLALVRDRLEAMAGPVLREHLLDADRLPVKAMVTAGTLLSKERSGAADINKHYTSGPNYLRRPPNSSPHSLESTMPSGLPPADHVVAHTLLNCLLREVSGPEHQTAVADSHLLLRLPRRDTLLRVALRRTSLTGAHRFIGPVEAQRADGGWAALDAQRLAALVQAELTLRTGIANDEFPKQFASSHAAVATALALRAQAPDPEPESGTRRGAPPASRYLESEQALLFGHRFHPTPKARSTGRTTWAAYAPEARAAFPLHHFAVAGHLIAEESAAPGATAVLDRLRPVPDGYRLLPVHPWQYELLSGHPRLRAALDHGDILDLGAGGEAFTATSSVRTLHGADVFLKFSLNVRITNCLRKNAWYELAGAVALTRLLGPALGDLATRFPGHAVLREPAYRSVSSALSADLLEGFGVIVRDGLPAHTRPGATPLLAAAVADEYPTSSAQLSRLLDGAGPGDALDWWGAYLRLLVPPVLAAYFDHGVVLEPHLQNVLIGVDATGLPVQVLLRDLEGTKLLSGHHADALARLPVGVARPMAYDDRRGWDRVVYCLLVNNCAEMAATLADLHPRLEPVLWAEARTVLQEYANEHGSPPRVLALLAGAPLPAKANLLTRWARRADREAEYVRIASPLAAARTRSGSAL